MMMEVVLIFDEISLHFILLFLLSMIVNFSVLDFNQLYHVNGLCESLITSTLDEFIIMYYNS